MCGSFGDSSLCNRALSSGDNLVWFVVFQMGRPTRGESLVSIHTERHSAETRMSAVPLCRAQSANGLPQEGKNILNQRTLSWRKDRIAEGVSIHGQVYFFNLIQLGFNMHI